MRSPTNTILTGLAVADLLVMVHYVPFTIHRNLPPSPLHFTHFSYGWAVFYKYHSLFTLVLHFISCTLTVVLAIWRYVFVTQVHTNRVCSSQKKTVMVVLISYTVCPITCIPILSTINILAYSQACDLNGFIVDKSTRYLYNDSQIIHENIYLLYPDDPYNLSLWLYTVVLKFVPCLLLTLLSYKIISALVEAQRRRANLLGGNNAEERSRAKMNAIHLFKENQADRTTKMLLAVLILFLLTEFPQGILGLISAILGGKFLEECYAPLEQPITIRSSIYKKGSIRGNAGECH
ncbi:sex peptide receptor-like [Anthonomus grandis grandis]|uniref:sex peptide receptor-like n=1 Tax=Anthonomus grandis grandis TaxID=2921223 RepID=UPI0021665F6A|nr:sex peptide receptor-like [Anthonomus grandis grandis]